MKLNGRNVSYGWLAVLAALTAVSALGLSTDVSEDL